MPFCVVGEWEHLLLGLCYDLIIIHKIFGLIELSFFDRDPRCAERLRYVICECRHHGETWF